MKTLMMKVIRGLIFFWFINAIPFIIFEIYDIARYGINGFSFIRILNIVVSGGYLYYGLYYFIIEPVFKLFKDPLHKEHKLMIQKKRKFQYISWKYNLSNQS